MLLALLKILIATDTMYNGSYFGVAKIYSFPDRKFQKKSEGIKVIIGMLFTIRGFCKLILALKHLNQNNIVMNYIINSRAY